MLENASAMPCCSKTRKWHSEWHKHECHAQGRENYALKSRKKRKKEKKISSRSDNCAA